MEEAVNDQKREAHFDKKTLRLLLLLLFILCRRL